MNAIFRLLNIQYRDDYKGQIHRIMHGLNTLATVFKANSDGGHCFISDEMAVWFRVLGFQNDPEFLRAMEPYRHSGLMLSKLWRVYTYCWAAKSASKTFLTGDMIDLGCYAGRMVDIADRYTGGTRTWHAYDLFESHPSDQIKKEHGPELYDKVCAMLNRPNIQVIKGMLPDSLLDYQVISFIHVDLNDAAAEVACLEKLWPKVVAGGIVLLDDHGWMRYQKSYEAHKAFFAAQGHDVYECPTGQGMVIKRGGL